VQQIAASERLSDYGCERAELEAVGEDASGGWPLARLGMLLVLIAGEGAATERTAPQRQTEC
jgi:hypothetical protein